MVSASLLIAFVLLLIFQILHIFEEIGMEVYKMEIIGSRSKYLRVASVIIVVYLLSFLFILLEYASGTILGIICSILAIGNFIIHSVGYLKVHQYRGTIASGVFSSIPLGILGIITLIMLIDPL
jgi:hypothetical protein